MAPANRGRPRRTSSHLLFLALLVLLLLLEPAYSQTKTQTQSRSQSVTRTRSQTQSGSQTRSITQSQTQSQSGTLFSATETATGTPSSDPTPSQTPSQTSTLIPPTPTASIAAGFLFDNTGGVIYPIDTSAPVVFSTANRLGLTMFFDPNADEQCGPYPYALTRFDFLLTSDASDDRSIVPFIAELYIADETTLLPTGTAQSTSDANVSSPAPLPRSFQSATPLPTAQGVNVVSYASSIALNQSQAFNLYTSFPLTVRA